MKKMMMMVAVALMTAMSVNAQSNDTSMFFKRIGCYLELDKNQIETVEISMTEFNEAMDALTDLIAAGKTVDSIVNRHKKQMKLILNDKQYKKYEEILDLTVRNTIEINNELRINTEFLASTK